MLDFFFLFLSSDPPLTDPMETEASARKAHAAILKMPLLTRKRPALMNPPTKKLPRPLAQELARGPAIVLTTRRAQKRKALHRPPTPPPLMRRRALRSPSQAPT